MKKDYQNNLHELSVRAHYVTGQSCMFPWLVLINRWDIKVVRKKAMSAKICTGKQWKTSSVQSHSQDYATNSCITVWAREKHQGGWEGGSKDRRYVLGSDNIKCTACQGLVYRMWQSKTSPPSNNTEPLQTLIMPQHHRGICIRPMLPKTVRSQGCELLAGTGAAFFMQCNNA